MTPRQDVAGPPSQIPSAAVGERGLLTRRNAMGLAAGLGFGAVMSASARGQPAPGAALPFAFNLATDIRAELTTLAPNVYAYVQREAPGQSNLSISNCGIVAGPKSLLAIDATAAPVQAKRFRAMAERATGRRIDRAVITHSHGDHTLGLQFLGDIDVVAQEETAAQMAQQAPARPIFWDPKNPAWSDGTEQFQVVKATTTYSHKMTYLGYGTEVQLLWPGRAHTLGDTNVYLPKEKIIFIGDIGFFGVTPLNGSGYIANWIKVCDDIMAMDVKVIVPGHGPVGGKAELADMKGYLVLIYQEAKKRFDRGITAGRAAAEIDLGKYATWTDPERILNNVTRLYMEFSGTIAASVPPSASQAARAEYEAIKRGR